MEKYNGNLEVISNKLNFQLVLTRFLRPKNRNQPIKFHINEIHGFSLDSTNLDIWHNIFAFYDYNRRNNIFFVKEEITIM